MKVYINSRVNLNMYSARVGFTQLGEEVEFFDNVSVLELEDDDVVVSSVQDVEYILKQKGKLHNILSDYPSCLGGFLSRDIYETTLGAFLEREIFEYFIKPKEKKKFNGFVCKGFSDVYKCNGVSNETEIWVSDKINFVSEYRCFVLDREIIDVRLYKGSPYKVLDETVLNDIVDSMVGANTFAVDVGITDKGETVLVEVTDGYGIGSYGLDSVLYARFLMSRWLELMS